MRLHRLRVTAYRGIEALDTHEIGENGLIVRGPNGVGKTSVLNAIRAALAAQDIGPDAIRLGSDRAEILVNMDDLSVKRVITTKGSKLSIETGAGASVRSPQTFLNDLLGTAPLDPIDLFAAKPKDRKEKILAALPVSVTAEQVAGWLGTWTLEKAPDLSLHGLEVVEQIRKEFAGKRTEQNGVTKELEKEIAALEAGAPPAVPDAPPVDVAEIAMRGTERCLAELDARADRVQAYEAKVKATRKRAEQLREDGQAIDAAPSPSPANVERAEQAHSAARSTHETTEQTLRDLEAHVLKVRAELATTQSAMSAAFTQVEQERAHQKRRADDLERAASMKKQADDLEAAIAATAEAPPTEDERGVAERACVTAAAKLAQARGAVLRAEHEAKINEARTRLTKEIEQAGLLNGMVAKFSKDVPNELLKAANGVPGLALDDDDIYLDNVAINRLSGREQLLFAVEIARRLNARAKILIVDGLERVDPDALPEFVEKATAGGFQLLATRVDAGEVVIEAIEPSTPKETETSK